VRVGILGGTFDPIHLGHLAAAEAARDCAGLDRVLLVPTGQPPHRPAAHAPPRDRLEMCRLAVAGREGLEVSDVEVVRQGPSYTAETLRRLRSMSPHDEYRLVLGWDAAREIRSWHEPEAVLDQARLVILGRPGLALPTPDGLAGAGLDPDRVQLCGEVTPDIRATEIRRRAAAGESLAGLVAPAVEAYIVARRLYSLASKR
jgi:nicotinate-nucleotide adenylyltransferase